MAKTALLHMKIENAKRIFAHVISFLCSRFLRFADFLPTVRFCHLLGATAILLLEQIKYNNCTQETGFESV